MVVSPQTALAVVAALSKPLARFCLRNAVGIQQAIEILKKAFIECATETIQASGDSANVSRLSIATGLHRRDVQRLIQDDTPVRQTTHALSRIIAAWENHPKFTVKNGKSRVLSVEGNDSEFHQLVRFITSDLHPGTVLSQLEHMGVVERTSQGAKLKHGAESIRHDPQRAYRVMAQDMEDLPRAVEDNVFTERNTPHLHARTEYDNVLQEAIPEIEHWLLKEGSHFHQRARAFISKYDCDLHPHKKGPAGARIAVGTFSISVKPKNENVKKDGDGDE